MYNIPELAFTLLQAMQKQIAVYRQSFPGLRIVFVEAQEEAPQSLADLRACVEAGELPIALEHGDKTIYQGDWANGIFRIFHDLGHLIYNKEMTYSDEVALAFKGWNDLSEHLPKDAPLAELYYLYAADTIGQSSYCHVTGRFPDDQQRFVELVRLELTVKREYQISTQEAAKIVAANHPDL